ncbi:renin receptor-like [Diaphorina citri]|uniref:Renin receptor-like n=1 Tax=Diaphorina citri TaxID=121845 RepID=A0A3Q0IR94_DIACI|nr:renin receptor-like [Diaphorina citri]
MKMLKSGLITLCSVLVTVRANEFSILHTPEAIEFQPSSTIDLRTVKDVFTAALGISVKQDHRWSGMDIKNPFETTEAVVSFIIPGLSSLNFLHAHDYDLLINDNTDNVYDSLLNLISHKYAANNQTTVKVTFKSSEPEVIIK